MYIAIVFLYFIVQFIYYTDSYYVSSTSNYFRSYRQIFEYNSKFSLLQSNSKKNDLIFSQDFIPSFELNSDSQNVIEKSSSTNDQISISAARAVLILVSAFYGTNFGCVKILGESMDPSTAACLRFTLAAIVFLPNLIKISKENPKLIKGG